VHEASEAAIALRPLAGDYAYLIFALCLANASLLGAIIVPLATAYYICEAMGWEAGVNKTFNEAPQFMWIYTLTIGLASIVILIPNAPLVFFMVLSAFVNGLLLPFVLIYALLLVNDKKLMGDYTNPKSYNYISWGTIIAIVGLTLFLIVTNILPSGRI
jgi:Mn2+/Fe2+ NRAMP family transporter